MAKSKLDFFYHYEDAFGEALVGFYEAVRDFDTSLGTEFSTYLWYRLKDRVGRYIHKELRQIELKQILSKGYSTITTVPKEGTDEILQSSSGV